MRTLPLRLFGFILLALAITIPSCKALFAHEVVQAPSPAASAQAPGGTGEPR